MYSRSVTGAALKIAILCRLYASCFGQEPVGQQVLTFLSNVDDTDQPYALYAPRNYDAAKKYPLVISLHDEYSNHRLNLRRVFGKGNRAGETDAEAARYWPQFRDVDFIVASPLARGTMGYKGIPEKDVFDVLADVKRRFSIDEDRIYLTGLSMGGGGALWIALTRPDVWAAVAVVCPVVPPGVEDLLANATDIPVRVFQGEADTTVPAATTRQWTKRMADAGVKAEYVEYRGIRHNAWDVAYKDGAIFDWFASHRRMRFPDRVNYSARAYKYSRAWWVQFDSFTPGEIANLDARFTGAKKLSVVTKNLEGFTLFLKGHPSAAGPGTLAITVDGTNLQSRTANSISFSKSAKGWVARPAVIEAGAKKAGAEGPVADALSGRQIYIYGTQGSPAPEEVKRRRDIVLQAAEWSTPRSKLLLTFRVMADEEVKPADLNGTSLILFGTKETNSLIAKYANTLPLSLNSSAADYGLVYVYPADGRYVVIHSGLPYFTRFEQTNRFELPFLNAPHQALMTVGDYLLFRGGMDNVIAEGRFDRNWKLPPDAAQTLRSTGAVEVR